MATSAPNLVKISEIAAELWQFSFFKMAAGRHLGFWYRSKVTLQHVTDFPYLPPRAKFCNCMSTGGWFIAFCGKIQNGVVPILNLYLLILGHPRSSLTALKSHRKFGVNRPFTFQDIAILKFRKFGLKRLLSPPKFTFLGVLTHKCYFSIFIVIYPHKALPWPETRVLSPHWSSYDARCDRDAERRVQK